MKFHNCLCMLILCMLLGSCIDPVSIEVPDTPSSLVVEGWFTNSANHNYVKLSRTISFSEAFPYVVNTPPVSAEVILYDEHGKQVEYLQETRQGFYPITALAEPGKAYRLQVIVGDTVYNSPLEMVPPESSMEDFEVVIEKRDKLVGGTPETRTTVLQLYFDLFATVRAPVQTDNYFLWKNKGIFEFNSLPFGGVLCDECLCWAPDLSLNKEVNLLSDKEFSGNAFRHKVATVEFDRSTRYLLTVEQYSINAGAFEYWNSILEQQTNTGSIFDPAPRRIMSNVLPEEAGNGEVFGYFTVAHITEKPYMLDRGRVAGQLGIRPIRLIESVEGDCRQQLESATSERPSGFN